MQLSDTSSSDLTISLTQSESEDDLPADEAPEINASYEGYDRKQHRHETSLHSNASKNTPQLDTDSSEPGVALQRYSIFDSSDLFPRILILNFCRGKKLFYCFYCYVV